MQRTRVVSGIVVLLALVAFSSPGLPVDCKKERARDGRAKRLQRLQGPVAHRVQLHDDDLLLLELRDADLPRRPGLQRGYERLGRDLFHIDRLVQHRHHIDEAVV